MTEKSTFRKLYESNGKINIDFVWEDREKYQDHMNEVYYEKYLLKKLMDTN